MELTPLRYFVTTARLLNYTKAASELYISRQALRQSIQSLEKELGTPLFINEKNHLSLTPAGELLTEKAAVLLDLANQAEFEVRGLSRQFDEISSAYSYSILTFLFPTLITIMSSFQDPHRAMNFQTRAASNDEIWDMLKKQEIRFGVMMCMPWDSPDYTFIPLQSFTLGLSLSRKHPLAAKERLCLSDLEGQSLMGMGAFSLNYHEVFCDLEKAGISCLFESVPDAIDAFYHVKHSSRLLFDLADHPDQVFPDTCVLPLESYSLHLCLVHRSDSVLTASEAFFFRYLKQYLTEHPIAPAP